MHFVVEKKGFSFWDGEVEVLRGEVVWELGLSEGLAALKQQAAGAPVEDRGVFEEQVKEGVREETDDLGQRGRPDHRGELDAAGEARQAELDEEGEGRGEGSRGEGVFRGVRFGFRGGGGFLFAAGELGGLVVVFVGEEVDAEGGDGSVVHDRG